MGFARIFALIAFTKAAIVEVVVVRDGVGVDYSRSGFWWDSRFKFIRGRSEGRRDGLCATPEALTKKVFLCSGSVNQVEEKFITLGFDSSIAWHDLLSIAEFQANCLLNLCVEIRNLRIVKVMRTVSTQIRVNSVQWDFPPSVAKRVASQNDSSKITMIAVTIWGLFGH